ncbi:MAG: N-acetyltransferase family protein [Planctomycetota bacterium]
MGVRPFEERDLLPTLQVWHASKQAAYPYLPLEQGRTLEEDRAFFEAAILPRCALWVATCPEVVGFLAFAGSYLDRLYVHPERQGRGVGSALLSQARRLSPAGLELHTHQANAQARRFYERHGFEVVELGISPPPECVPDVRYRLRPSPLSAPAAPPSS